MSLVAGDRSLPWLAEVTDEWPVGVIKYECLINPDVLPESTSPLQELDYIDIGGVSSTGIIETPERMVFEDAPSRARRLPKKGDTIVSTVRTYLKAIAAIDWPQEHPILVCSTGFAVLRSLGELDERFLFWWMRSDRVVDEVVSRSTGVSYPAINASEIACLSIPKPPLETQRRIAAFLDRKTAAIDALIAKKQRLITLLQEKRQALITHAVTKGLDPDAPMKDSGVPWIGEIPTHWEAATTKLVAELRSGHTPSRNNPDYWEDCHIPWFSLADVWQIRDGINEYLGETKEKISDLGLANSAADLLPEGTVIVSRTASVGFSGIMPVPMATTQDFVNWIPGPKISSEYLLYVFRAMVQEFERLKVGSTHKTIYMPDVMRFKTPLPPLVEQKEIVDFIRANSEHYLRLIQLNRLEIGKLTEYRQSIISAAVTGQLDIPEEAA